MLWTTIDGRSWSLTIGDKKAVVWLMEDEETYGANIWWCDLSKLVLNNFDCIKEAKKACLEEIERANAQEEANKPIPSVILRGKIHYSDYTEYHETVKDAAVSAYWGINDNTFFPDTIEDEGKIVWISPLFADDDYPTLASLAGIEEES